MNIKLRECPFCGAIAEYKTCNVNDKHENFVQCTVCKVHSPVFYYGQDSIDWWNKRYNPT